MKQRQVPLVLELLVLLLLLPPMIIVIMIMMLPVPLANET